MTKTKALLFLVTLAFIIVGCGSQTSVKKGDRLVVVESLRESAETLWEEDYTDGFVAVIPEGTILEVLFNPRTGAGVIECVPVEVNGSKELDAVEKFFVPDHIRNRDGFKGYSFSIKTEYLGKKVKKAD